MACSDISSWVSPHVSPGYHVVCFSAADPISSVRRYALYPEGLETEQPMEGSVGASFDEAAATLGPLLIPIVNDTWYDGANAFFQRCHDRDDPEECAAAAATSGGCASPTMRTRWVPHSNMNQRTHDT